MKIFNFEGREVKGQGLTTPKAWRRFIVDPFDQVGFLAVYFGAGDLGLSLPDTKSWVLCSCPVEHLSQFASKSVRALSKCRVHKFGDGRTDGPQRDNITPPPATLACGGVKTSRICVLTCMGVALDFTDVWLHGHGYILDLWCMLPMLF